jgi:hypothetical protein
MVSYKVISVMWTHNFSGIYQAFGDVRNLFPFRVLSDLTNMVVCKYVFVTDFIKKNSAVCFAGLSVL